MTKNYERQSSFIDGDVILAEHGNAEFDRLVEVFSEADGHNHDGTVQGGAFVPLLKDPSGTHNLTLDATGVTGSVLDNDPTLTEDSAKRIPTQQAAKAYVDNFKSILDGVDAGLQSQIDLFGTSNHAHSNKAQLDEYESTVVITADDTLDWGYHYILDAVHNPTLPNTFETNKIYLLTNSTASNVILDNPAGTLEGTSITLNPGDNIILEPRDTFIGRATGATTMEVL